MKAIEELRPLLLTEFQCQLLDAAKQSLQAFDNPLRLNNFSTAFRELVRHVLENLAPSDEIERCTWYVPDSNSKTGMTRAHRVSFFIHGGIAPEFAEEELGIDIQGERRKLNIAANTLSKFTHVNPDTFNLPPNEVEAYAIAACEALNSMLVNASEARRELVDAIIGQVEDEVISAALSETVMSVYDISPHHSIDEVYIGGLEVVRIGAEHVEFKAYGSLGVQLQWGSSSDIRRGDGMLKRENFRLTMALTSSVDDPIAVIGKDETLFVDTSAWDDNDILFARVDDIREEES